LGKGNIKNVSEVEEEEDEQGWKGGGLTLSNLNLSPHQLRVPYKVQNASKVAKL
jgi:hypothetical protein